MSVHVIVAERRRLPPHRQLLPRLAVGAAHLIARLPPVHIRRLLTLAARDAKPATYAQAAQARADVTAVSIRCAGNGCLPRSIATALLCRAQGTWPTWHAGVRVIPFTAHAWVETDGTPVDEPCPTTSLHPLITVPPGTTPAPPINQPGPHL
ncbi:lasso peptide biosynthesis B2 protein [Streptomyces mayteni]